MCYTVTLVMRRFSAKDALGQPVIKASGGVREDNREGIDNGHKKNPGARLFDHLDSYFRRLINGWLRYSLMFTGRIPSHLMRNFIYRHVYHLTLGKKAIIYGGSEIRAPYNIAIGEGTIIGDDSKLDGRNGIIIGKNVNFSTGVWIWTDQHNTQCPHFSCVNQGGPVIVDDRAWISCRTVLLPGVHIGEGAVIAAGAVVTDDVEPFSIYGGIPAKKIGERNKDLVYEFSGKPLPFY